MTLYKKPFENIVGKGENAGNPSKKIQFSVTYMLSANDFNLDQSKFCRLVKS